MNKSFACATAVAAGACLGCTGTSGADFYGWTIDHIDLPNGNVIINVYAGFTRTSDRLLRVYDANVTTNVAGGFHQSEQNPFWVPAFQDPQTDDDSFVCIDVNPAGNATASYVTPDPNFVNFDDVYGATTFNAIEGVGSGAGWTNANPTGSIGLADGYKVLVAHFVARGTPQQHPSGWLWWNVTLSYESNGQTQHASQSIIWPWHIVPGPGGLAFLGLGALAPRRRRA